MKKQNYLLSGALMLLPMVTLADSGSNEYLSDWWHQSINIVGSNSTRFGPLKDLIYIRNIEHGRM
jgi:nucleoside-specific channel-forming protein